MHDLFLIQRYYSQTEFVAYQMVQMIQTISQNRENKRITPTDLKNIVAAAYLSIYPGTTMYYEGRGHYFIHFPHPIIWCVKGISGGKASCIWKLRIHTGDASSNSPSKISYEARTQEGMEDTATLYWKTNVDPSEIYSKLKMKEGEIKIIVEPVLYWHPNIGNTAGNRAADDRAAFGLHLVKPKSGRSRGFFSSPVIFSPNPGLFDETPPQ